MKKVLFSLGLWNLLMNHHQCFFAHGSREVHYLKDDSDKKNSWEIAVFARIKRPQDSSNLSSLVIPLQERWSDGIKDQGKYFYLQMFPVGSYRWRILNIRPLFKPD